MGTNEPPEMRNESDKPSQKKIPPTPSINKGVHVFCLIGAEEVRLEGEGFVCRSSLPPCR